MRLIIVRHGETADNASRLIQGHSMGSLSARGIQQAGMLAERLLTETINCIYSSDLPRAAETAGIVAEKQKDCPLVLDRRLREQHFGVHEGRPVCSLFRGMRTASSGFGSYDPPGGEPALVFSGRLRHFIDEHISYQPGRTVALVTHFGVMRVVLPMLLGGPEGMPGMKCIPNGFFTILDIDCRGRATPVSGEG